MIKLILLVFLFLNFKDIDRTKPCLPGDDNIEVINPALDSLIRSFAGGLGSCSCKRGNYFTIHIKRLPSKNFKFYLTNYMPGLWDSVVGELRIDDLLVFFSAEDPANISSFIKIKYPYIPERQKLDSLRVDRADSPYGEVHIYAKEKFSRYIAPANWSTEQELAAEQNQ